MNDILEHVELLRIDASRKLAPGRKAELGQFNGEHFLGPNQKEL
jgi:hypothetical protein